MPHKIEIVIFIFLRVKFFADLFTVDRATQQKEKT